MVEVSHIATRLEKARELAEAGDAILARAEFEAILQPVLERPWALEMWMKLACTLEPGAQRRIRRCIESWLATAKAVVSTEPLSAGQETRSDEFISPTLAKLYWDQGHRDKALDIYRLLLEKDPDNHALQEEFMQRSGDAGDVHSSQNTTLAALEAWAGAIERRRGDLKDDVHSSQNATLASLEAWAGAIERRKGDLEDGVSDRASGRRSGA